MVPRAGGQAQRRDSPATAPKRVSAACWALASAAPRLPTKSEQRPPRRRCSQRATSHCARLRPRGGLEVPVDGPCPCNQQGRLQSGALETRRPLYQHTMATLQRPSAPAPPQPNRSAPASSTTRTMRATRRKRCSSGRSSRRPTSALGLKRPAFQLPRAPSSSRTMWLPRSTRPSTKSSTLASPGRLKVADQDNRKTVGSGSWRKFL